MAACVRIVIQALGISGKSNAIKKRKSTAQEDQFRQNGNRHVNTTLTSLK